MESIGKMMMINQTSLSKIDCFLCKCGEKKLSIEPVVPGWTAPQTIRCKCGNPMVSAGHPPGIQEMGDLAEVEFIIPQDSKQVKQILEDLLPFTAITYGDAQRSFQRAIDLKIFIYKLKAKQ
jgi:hypothetical protein